MREIKTRLLQVLQHHRGDIPLKLLEKKLGIKRNELRTFKNIIAQLEREGVVMKNEAGLRLNRNVNNGKRKAVTAIVSRLAGTFGFAKLEGEDKEVFIPGKYLKGAMPGDRVELILNTAKEGLDDGKVTEILEERQSPILGTVSHQPDGWFLEADKGFRRPIYLGRFPIQGVEEGDRVLGEISKRGVSHDDHIVTLTDSFGSGDHAKNCVEGILEGNEIPRVFPEECVEQAEKIAMAGIHPKEVLSRVDLRDLDLFTIDSAYSKDMDDAVSLEKTDKGYRLGVHIADVSYYVSANTPLDREAFKRGNSIYYADCVIPMLPKALSNELCSLNPNTDRLALSVFMEIGHAGELISYDFQRTIIHSRIKGVYSEINEILEGKASEDILQKYAVVLSQVYLMKELSDILSEKRRSGGSLELSSVESQISLNEMGEAVAIHLRTTGASEHIIEEFMLCANQAAARFALEKHLPFVYRIHEKPSPQKLEALCEVLNSVGISAEGIEVGVSQKRLSKVLKEANRTPYGQVVNGSLLRSMSKAKYSPENIGHYGLGFQDYAHFTSPIRRYSDLAIHRIISSVLIGMRADNIQKRFAKFVSETSLQATNCEIKAMTVERECENCYKAEYMSQFVGETFEGLVSGVTAHGLYVQLSNTVEGLISSKDIPEDFTYDGRMRYLSAVTGKVATIGTPCEVKVKKVSIPLGQIDFQLMSW